jgi:V-type H+-transporting ATPase subunit a
MRVYIHASNADIFYFLTLFLVQIKRTGEMARKLRFFKEQMLKAGIQISPMQPTDTPLDFDDMEVCQSPRYS